MNKTATATRTEASTRESLKAAARALFTEHGVDAVSVRDIVTAAGQRNGAAIHYHFGGIDRLLTELVVDGARPLDERRVQLLDALEGSGKPVSVRDMVEVLVEPIVGGGPDERSYVRFLSMVQFGHRRTLFLEALDGRWNTGWQRALKHLKQLLPEVPAGILKQRMLYLELFIGSFVAQREFAASTTSSFDRPWRTAYALDNLVDSLCAMLEVAPSAQTLSKL